MIFIGYRRQIGRDDVSDIVDFLKKHKEFTEVYIIYKEPLTDVVKNLLAGRNFYTVRTDYLRKTLKGIKTKGKSKAYFLDEFGKRKLRNPCGRSLSKSQYW